jgi:hypothetical protein
MRRRNWKRSFGVQRLEDRRLLAADVAVDLAPVENHEPEMCQVAELEAQDESGDQGETLDLDSTEIPVDVVEGVIDESAQSQVDSEGDTETEADPGETGEVVQNESEVHDLGDPVDGTDGFFGSIDAANPEGQLTFSPSEEGMIDVVVASSFGGAETRLEITDSSGGLVTSTMTEELSGFQKLSFEAEAGESYQLNVSSEEGAEGYFQVTVEHSEIPEPVDLHVDTIGEDSTELQFVDGSSEIQGELELAGDVDTFRFTAESNGKAMLGLAETDAENATELQIQVLNADGDLLTRGITNETVGVSFDVQQGTEYFLAVSAAEDQTGAFEIDLAFESTDVDPDVIVDEVADDQPVVDDVIVDDVIADDVIVDEVVADDAIVDDAIVDDVVADQSGDQLSGDSVAGENALADDVVVDDVVVDDEVIEDTIADDTIVDDGIVEDQPVEDLVADDTGEDCIDELIEGEPVSDQPIEVEVVSDQPDEVVGADDLADVGEIEGDVAIDQIDDVPDFDDLTSSLTGEIEDDVQPTDEVVADEVDDVATDLEIQDELKDSLDESDVVSVDDLIDEENEICFSDLFLNDGDTVDSFFAQFNPDSIFQVRRGFGLRG